MKKALFITFIAVLTLCSCGNKTQQAVESSSVVAETVTRKLTDTPTEAPTEEPTKPQKKTPNEEMIEAPQEEATELSEEEKQRAEAFKELTEQYDYICTSDTVYTESVSLYDDDNVSISADWWLIADNIVSIRLMVENKSDTNIIFESKNTSVNEYDVDLYCYEHISAHKTKAVFAENKKGSLKGYPISGRDITSVEFRARVLDENTYEELYVTDMLTIQIDQSVPIYDAADN